MLMTARAICITSVSYKTTLHARAQGNYHVNCFSPTVFLLKLLAFFSFFLNFFSQSVLRRLRRSAWSRARAGFVDVSSYTRATSVQQTDLSLAPDGSLAGLRRSLLLKRQRNFDRPAFLRGNALRNSSLRYRAGDPVPFRAAEAERWVCNVSRGSCVHNVYGARAVYAR